MEREGVAGADLGAFTRFDVAVDGDLAIGDDDFAFATTADQALEFQDLAEFDKVGIDGDAFGRFGGHDGQERRFDLICRCEFPAKFIYARRESGGRVQR